MHLDYTFIVSHILCDTYHVISRLNAFQSQHFCATGLSRLYELDASHNELVALTDGLLEEQPNLHYLSFAHNQIQVNSEY